MSETNLFEKYDREIRDVIESATKNELNHIEEIQSIGYTDSINYYKNDIILHNLFKETPTKLNIETTYTVMVKLDEYNSERRKVILNAEIEIFFDYSNEKFKFNAINNSTITYQ